MTGDEQEGLHPAFTQGGVSHREHRVHRVFLWVRLQPDVIDAVDEMACGHHDRLKPAPHENLKGGLPQKGGDKKIQWKREATRSFPWPRLSPRHSSLVTRHSSLVTPVTPVTHVTPVTSLSLRHSRSGA